MCCRYASARASVAYDARNVNGDTKSVYVLIMSYILPRLETKKEVDKAIKETVDKVLVLRFGNETDLACLQLDDIVIQLKRI